MLFSHYNQHVKQALYPALWFLFPIVLDDFNQRQLVGGTGDMAVA
jgi:hypothetical protein